MLFVLQARQAQLQAKPRKMTTELACYQWRHLDQQGMATAKMEEATNARRLAGANPQHCHLDVAKDMAAREVNCQRDAEMALWGWLWVPLPPDLAGPKHHLHARPPHSTGLCFEASADRAETEQGGHPQLR